MLVFLSLGALGSFGAALLEPYTDRATTSGTLIYTKEVIGSMVESFVKHVGLHVEIR